MSPSDAELACQALAGSQTACRMLVARYATAAVSLAARLVNDRALAEDMAQEAFIRVFARLATYDPARKFSSWFFQVVRNVAVDYLRRKRIHTVSLEDVEVSGHAGVGGDPERASPEALAVHEDLRRALEQALARLRPEYREAIVLRYQEGLTHPEIGAILGVPSGTVKTYLHRGRKELAALMTAQGWAPPGRA